MILDIFDLQVPSILPNQVLSQMAFFGSGEEAQRRFSRWPPWRPSRIFNWNDFSYFCSARCPDTSYQVSGELAFLSRRSVK